MKTTSDARVFMAERSQHDVRSLEDYGEVVMLFTEQDVRPGIFEPDYEHAVLAKLDAAGFEPARDYIAVVGPVVPVVRAVSAAQRRYGWLRALMFNASFRSYTAVTLGEQHRRHDDARRTGRRIHTDEEGSRAAVPPVAGGAVAAAEHGPARAR